jgi:predicted dehydrogenase
MALSEARITALASRNTEKARESALRYGAAKAYGSYEALLADPDVEAVYISLPNNLHLEWCIRAMEAGKHVLCEKPFAMDAAQARMAAAVAARTGTFLMEAFMYRFHPQWRRVKKAIECGEIGSIRAVHAFFSFNLTDPSNIRNIRETGGGALYDIGCYAISSARFIVGREPERVVSLITRDKQFGTDILSSAILDFGTTRATFSVTTQSFPFQRVEILGSSGRITVVLPFNAFPDVPLEVQIATSVGTRTWMSQPEDQYGLMFQEASLAIREGRPAPTPVSDAIANMAVLDAVFASEESGGWVPVSKV